ncbi:hypothetical protein [Streptomyces poonensis]|uniref:Uncharacterized protein n=1 Tax=Streptomyces poonensis TaxID=68255 RepID=A0A918PDG8_9ACTN|nr:hypothetical protein [Streptomyces poonensis]GGY99841.1 hypothetical protein GCM10010365_18230 [Streptomyces poonensis]GLJ92188.1 hypothetical protein GCM10017589_47970 [Streptomyces poonensis]
MNAHGRHRRPDPPADRRVVERLVPSWLRETERYDAEAAREARSGWERGALPPDAAQDLANWVTARVTDTGFNEDEGPFVDGPVRITPADKESVHRWLAAQGHPV